MDQVKLKYLCTSYSTPITQDQINKNGQYKVYGASGLVGYLPNEGCKTTYLGIVKDGAGVGRINAYEAGSYLLGTMAYIIPNSGVNIKWLKYAIMSLDLGKSISKTTIPHIYFSEYSNRKVGWSSLDTQARIADFLDYKCDEIDSVIAITQKTIEEYKALKQSIITEVVTKGIRGDRPMKSSGIEWIGEIPAEWDVIRVKQLLKERNERSKEGKEEPLSMSQKVGLVPTKFLESIPNMASSFVGAKLAYVDDLVFNKLKAHLGVFSVSRYDGLVSPDYAVYCSTGKSNLKYLEYIFKTPQCIGEFRKKSTGIAAGLMRLYTEGLFSIYLPYPALSEQEEIAEYLNEKCTGIDALIVKKQQYLIEIENYKKSLIYEYVTGKKEVV